MKPKVLLVDDVPENLEILLQILQPKGYLTLVAGDGASALKVASQAVPDLILLDIMMPDMDGFEVCRQLSQQPATADIPVIFLSALNDVDWKMKGFEAGSVDYISKPYWENEVLARVSAHLRLRGAQKELEATNAQLRQEVEQRKQAEAALAEANGHLERANRRLQDLASEDGLTGIPNRRRLDEHLTMSWLQMAREKLPLSILMADVDCFKPYNDHYGHQAGDDCLRAVAKAIQGALKRPVDLAGRYGGEEFMAVLYNTDLAGALVVAEEIRQAVRRLAIEHQVSTAGRVVSLSLGAACAVPDQGGGGSLAELIGVADAALYQAKRAGRDRVEARSYIPASGVHADT